MLTVTRRTFFWMFETCVTRTRRAMQKFHTLREKKSGELNVHCVPKNKWEKQICEQEKSKNDTVDNKRNRSANNHHDAHQKTDQSPGNIILREHGNKDIFDPNTNCEHAPRVRKTSLHKKKRVHKTRCVPPHRKQQKIQNHVHRKKFPCRLHGRKSHMQIL